MSAFSYGIRYVHYVEQALRAGKYSTPTIILDVCFRVARAGFVACVRACLIRCVRACVYGSLARFALTHQGTNFDLPFGMRAHVNAQMHVVCM